MDDEQVREWSEEPPSLCRSACLFENEGKGEHQVRVTFDRPSFNTSRQKKKTRRSSREEDVYSVFETVACIKARTMIQLRVYTVKEIRRFPEKIYRLYCFHPVEDCYYSEKYRFINKCQTSSPRDIVSIISNVPSVSDVFHFYCTSLWLIRRIDFSFSRMFRL